MNNNAIDVTRDLKKAERKQKWESFKNNARRWWNDNRQYAVVIIPAVGAVLVKGIQILGKMHAGHMETINKDRRCYDTSLGHYWELKRKLKNSEWTEIERRRKGGESLGEILDDMDVLK